MLTDSTTYLQLTSDPTNDCTNKFIRLVEEGVYMGEGVLTQKQAKCIVVEHPSIPIFHSVPKLHKSLFFLHYVLLYQ